MGLYVGAWIVKKLGTGVGSPNAACGVGIIATGFDAVGAVDGDQFSRVLFGDVFLSSVIEIALWNATAPRPSQINKKTLNIVGCNERWC